MPYIVLARKHRPPTFDEVLGQKHITDLLSKSIKADRIAHALLFCGPRGIGKTTCARIFAKCLNCEKGPTITPCGKCAACAEIAKGNSFDVLEIDGASNRGIDEIRTLRENVKFAPTGGKYKVYIIDEVHMLTTEAFNALLKTLEEPPEHVKFIFATTDPNKVPATIISRCQRFDFKRIPIKVIVESLEAVSKKEKFKIDEDALYAMAKAAQGSLRDGLSILDQLSALGQDMKAQDVFSMLGLVETTLIFELVDALGKKDCVTALQTLEAIIEKGKDVKQLVKDLIDHFRNLMVIKVGGKGLGKLVDHPVAIKEMFLQQCELFELKSILKSIDLMIEAQEMSRFTESRRIPLEIAFAKMTYTGERQIGPRDEATSTAARQKEAPKKVLSSAKKVLGNTKGHVHVSREPEPANEPEKAEGSVPADEEEAYITEKEKIDPSTIDISRIRKMWEQLTFAVSREKMSVATYLQEAAPYQLEGDELTIAFPKQFSFHKETLEDQANVLLVENVFNEKLNTKIRMKYILSEDVMTHDEEEHVQSAIDTFGGEVVERWHND